MKKDYTFYVSGMHCASCVLLTEAEVKEIPGVTSAHANLSERRIHVSGDFGDATEEEVLKKLSRSLEQHGYSLSLSAPESAPSQRSVREFAVAIPIAFGFLVLYVGLQKIGLVNLIPGGTATYGTAFIIGVIASLSTCMAVVGGIVLTMSSAFAKAGGTVRPLAFFHIGRMVSFGVLGGVLGALGSAMQLNDAVVLVMSIAIAVVMIVIGVDLLDVFAWSKKVKPTMPKIIARHAMGVSRWNHTFAPVAIGVATFFLPCGFTQSMQLYALTTGSFVEGALTMIAFALGTFPVLALLSFGLFRIERSPKKSIFFKVAGMIILVFAVFNLLNAFAAAGYISPLFSF